jgi:hypothetical protein
MQNFSKPEVAKPNEDKTEFFMIRGQRVVIRPGTLGVVDKAMAIAKSQIDTSWKKNRP